MFKVTPQAKEKLKLVLQEKAQDPKVAFRVILNPLKPRQVDFILDKVREGDVVVESEHGRNLVLINSKLASKVKGLVLDYLETSRGSNFIISKFTLH